MHHKILVTGADGFIGSHLVEKLVEQGHEVTAFCCYNSFGHLGWLSTLDAFVQKQFQVVLGDIRDPYSVEEAVRGNTIVFHLAALIGIPYSYLAPSAYVETNVAGTLNVLQAAKKWHVQQVMHTSTSEVYGSAQYVPIDEKHPLVGQSPYAASKIGADQMALSFQRSFGVPVSIVRPFNTYGPRQSMRAVIPTILLQLLSGQTKIKLGNLETTRDFNYVKDTVSGMLSFMGNQNALGRSVNIGSNYEISVRDTALLIAELLGKPIEFELDASRVRPEQSEVERLWADNQLARELLDWTPQYAGLDGFRKGLEETIAWFEKNHKAFLYSADVGRYAV